jgi:hypothetical protein
MMSGTGNDDWATVRKVGCTHQSPHRCEPFALGRERFARISAVEGIALTDEMRAMLDGFEQQGFSADERRRAIHQRFRGAQVPEFE